MFSVHVWSTNTKNLSSPEFLYIGTSNFEERILKQFIYKLETNQTQKRFIDRHVKYISANPYQLHC